MQTPHGSTLLLDMPSFVMPPLTIKFINHDCLPILMLLYIMLYIVLAYLMLFAALTNSVCLNNASLFFNNIFYDRAMSSPEK